jgi:hypothetical protein
VKAVRDLQLGRVDHREGHVHPDHGDDGDGKAEIAESSPNLGKFSEIKFKWGTLSF